MSKRVLIKYGEKEHLEKIEEGKIRFAPSQVYVKMEEDLHNKGQGDLLEGKFVFHAEGLKLTRTDTGETITLSGKQRLSFNAPDINNMPVFCISEYREEYFTDDDKLCIPQDKINSIKSLQKSGAQITNIVVTDNNIKSFDRVARKYGIDYSLKKVEQEGKSEYLVFFKAKDVDVMTAAFKEYTSETLKKQKRESVRQKLEKVKEELSNHRQLKKEKKREQEPIR